MLRITRNQTPTFFATLVTASNALFDVDDFQSGNYTIYKSSSPLLSRVPARYLTPVEGFANVEIPSGVIVAAGTVTSSNLNYNFKFSPNALESFPFSDVGIYFVEFQVTPTTGNPIVWQRTVEVV